VSNLEAWVDSSGLYAEFFWSDDAPQYRNAITWMGQPMLGVDDDYIGLTLYLLVEDRRNPSRMPNWIIASLK